MAKGKQLSHYMEPEHGPKEPKPVKVKLPPSDDVVNMKAVEVPAEYMHKLKALKDYLEQDALIPAALGGGAVTGLGKAVTISGMMDDTMNGDYFIHDELVVKSPKTSNGAGLMASNIPILNFKMTQENEDKKLLYAQMYGSSMSQMWVRGLRRTGPWPKHQFNIPVRSSVSRTPDLTYRSIEPESKRVDILLDPMTKARLGPSDVVPKLEEAVSYTESFLQDNPDLAGVGTTESTLLSLMVGFADRGADKIREQEKLQMYRMEVNHSYEMSRLRDRLLEAQKAAHDAQLEADKYKNVASITRCEGRAFRDEE